MDPTKREARLTRSSEKKCSYIVEGSAEKFPQESILNKAPASGWDGSKQPACHAVAIVAKVYFGVSRWIRSMFSPLVRIIVVWSL